MTISIMQPYFLPYLGYFQLIDASDVFVIYDNIQYTKKGWINRNRFLFENKPTTFTLPIKKDSHLLNINERILVNDYITNNKKILKKVKISYKNSKNFNKVFPLLEEIFLFESNNLFDFILNSLEKITNYLEIDTKIVLSSHINDINHNLKSQERVINICKSLNTKTYINPIGGTDLYDRTYFKKHGIDLMFHRIDEIFYEQNTKEFIPYLSIIDTLMMTDCKEKLKEYRLL